MSISYSELKAGVKMPTQEAYVSGLEDSIIIQPVPLKRYREYKDKVNDLLEAIERIDKNDTEARTAAIKAANTADDELTTVMLAESISGADNMSLEDARQEIEELRSTYSSAVFDEICTVVMGVILGKDRSQMLGNG